jgi:hypothetical protein
MEFWKEVFGLAANVVLLITAITAIFGVAKWAKEHKGRKRIDLAEDVLATAYEAAEAISYMRSPFSFDSEAKDLVRHESETDAQFRLRKTYSVAYFRYQQNSELFSKLRTLCYRVEAVFGKPHGAPIRELLKAPHQVITAGSSLARLIGDSDLLEPEARARNFDFRQKLEAKFWEGMDNDVLTAELNRALESIGTFARIVIENDGELDEKAMKIDPTPATTVDTPVT